MSNLKQVLAEIDLLKAKLDSLLPMKREDEERLWKKFRLEWNYNSNHIEGNTLTYGQTELLLIFDKTTGDHDMREYEEMKAHDVAIKKVVEYANDKSRDLAEADIRELNKLILVRPFWSDAITPDGQPTRKLIQPGEYKKQPNSVRLQNGEIFHYASPEETPAKMEQLIQWYRQASTDEKIHPVEVAARLHYDFVRIHPFDDSNGRTARLLMNYALIRNGYPPTIVKSDEKKAYLDALNKADVGNFEAFIEYIAECQLWSLNLSINASKGLSINESSDITKEIALWKRSINPLQKYNAVKSYTFVVDFIEKNLMTLFFKLIEKHRVFDDLFVLNQVSIFSNGVGESIASGKDLEDFFKVRLSGRLQDDVYLVSNDTKLSLSISHQHYKLKPERRSFFTSSIEVDFKPLVIEMFHVSTNSNRVELAKLPYKTELNPSEIEDMVNKALAEDFSHIKNLQQ